MKITSAKVIICAPSRNFVTLKLTTDDGLTGLGDATLNGRELGVVAYLREHIIPLLIGVLSNKRTEGKIRLYERQLGKPSGAFFLYGARTGEHSVTEH